MIGLEQAHPTRRIGSIPAVADTFCADSNPWVRHRFRGAE
jgi:hypothetical protein